VGRKRLGTQYEERPAGQRERGVIFRDLFGADERNQMTAESARLKAGAKDAMDWVPPKHRKSSYWQTLFHPREWLKYRPAVPPNGEGTDG
jgi:hypothetical protein